MVKLKERKTQRIAFLVIVTVVFSIVAFCDVNKGSYFQYKNGDFNNATGGMIHYSYRTGSETQYVHFYEDVYKNGELISSGWILSLGVGGEVRKSKLSLMLINTSNLGWAINADGAVTYWTSKLEDPSYSGRTVEYLHTRKQVLTGEDDLVLAAVYQSRVSGKANVYSQDCENVLENLDAVISNNDTVVLIRMVTSQKPC